VQRHAFTAHLRLRWKGGAITELDVLARAPRVPALRTDEQTIDLLRRLAPHYPNALIAGILKRQGRHTVHGYPFTAEVVRGLRRSWKLPSFTPLPQSSDEQVLTVRKAAKVLGVSVAALHRYLNDGIIVGAQLTAGAPWRIRITEELRARFHQEAPQGYLPMVEAMHALGVSRQTVLQRVKRGELEALYISRGRHKGLRIKVLDTQFPLFGTNLKDFRATDFISELLQHLPNPRVRLIRRYGLYSSRSRGTWLRMPHLVRLAPEGWKQDHAAQTALRIGPLEEQYVETAAGSPLPLFSGHSNRQADGHPRSIIRAISRSTERRCRFLFQRTSQIALEFVDESFVF